MGGGVSDVFDPVVDVVKDVGSSVGEAVEDVGDVVQDVIDVGKDVGQAVEGVGNVFDPPAPPELPDIPPPPTAEDIVGGFQEAQEQARPQEAAQMAETRARRVQAGQSTIRTSSQGVLEPALTTRTLLGS